MLKDYLAEDVANQAGFYFQNPERSINTPTGYAAVYLSRAMESTLAIIEHSYRNNGRIRTDLHFTVIDGPHPNGDEEYNRWFHSELEKAVQTESLSKKELEEKIREYIPENLYINTGTHLYYD